MQMACSVFCAAQPVQSSVLCNALCSTAWPAQRSVHCTVQHSLSSPAFCAMHCAAQSVHYSVLCAALCSTACPVQRSVHCTDCCSIWRRLKTVTAAVRLLREIRIYLYGPWQTDRQTRAARCDRQTVASAVGGFVSFTGDADPSGAHPASCSTGTWVFPPDKPAGAWSWPLTSIQCQEALLFLH